MNAARIPVRGFQIEDCEFYGGLQFCKFEETGGKNMSHFTHFKISSFCQ